MNPSVASAIPLCTHQARLNHLRRKTVFATLLCLTALTFGTGLVAQTVSIAPSTRTEQMQSAPLGLPDQQFQKMNLRVPLTTSLITVANLGGTGHRSFLLTLQLAHGGSVSFSVKEGGEDITLALSQPVPVTAISVRCDSFSAVNCKYAISLVGT